MRGGVLAGVLFLVVIIAHGESAPTDTGNVDGSNNVQAEALKTKLKRLHELLQELFSEERQSESGPEAMSISNSESAVTSEDMGGQQENYVSEEPVTAKVEAVEPQTPPKRPVPPQPEVHSTFKGLAQALQRFRLSRQKSRRTGHVSRADVRGHSEVMESLVARAMERLGQEDRDEEEEEVEAERQKAIEAEREKEMETVNQKVSDDSRPKSSEQADMDPLYEIFHAKAMAAVEQKLMQDLRAAAELGVSVDMLIADLQGQDYMESEDGGLEQQLSGLARRRWL